MSKTGTRTAHDRAAEAAQDKDLERDDETTETKSTHKPEAGDVGETGDHGDLGENAK